MSTCDCFINGLRELIRLV